jgi:tRNA pseudouridine13 synthase
MFWTKTAGIGGHIRQRVEDFNVREIPKTKPVDKDPTKNVYTLFTLEKWNWDPNLAIKALARALRVSITRFGIAGTKDRRAVTSQRVSVWKVGEERLKEVSVRGLRLSDFQQSSERIVLGDLEGNSFNVTIRRIEIDKQTVEDRLRELANELKEGIPNLFGPQRFGTVRPVTSLVGRALLKGDFEGACRTYIAQVFEDEPDDSKEARNFVNAGWGKKETYLQALETFPERLKFERGMLDWLSKTPTDYAGALRKLPKRLRKMFVNAVQSEIWNAVVSNAAAKGRLEQQELPLPGHDTIFDDKNPLHRELQRVMDEMGIGLADFKLPRAPELATSGSARQVLLIPKDLKVSEVGADDFNEGKMKATVEFTLPAGAYATVVLAELMKSNGTAAGA